MDIEKIRGEFKEWARSKGMSLPVNDEIDYNDWTQLAWDAWKASRESLIVELPSPFWPGYIEDDGDTAITADLFTCAQVKDAIHAAGVKTK